MESRAVAKHVRISPRRARQVVDLVRGKPVGEALNILRFMPNKAATPVYKVVESAAANAENNFDMNRDDLYIAKIYVDEGPTWKRIRPRARGMADRIRKRTSHITVVLAERE
ncbi:MAG: 50S ribosomal protein L22 [Firmicutes bacterium]|jgi:large subunit ribosomal protein L22|nr:50S ribosomal protein L22 [Bacillota bacterium]